MSLDDEILVQQSLKGNQKAFETLVDRYQNAVYAVAWHHVHNFHDAQDIVQETFIDAYRHLSALTDGRKFSSWLRRIAANRAKMWLRKQKANDSIAGAILCRGSSKFFSEKPRTHTATGGARCH
ncbi:MAG: RNA polymerase sigma factor [Candidatus Poribacteria bacterium]